MRNLIVCNIMSLDGYCEGPGGNVMALPMDGFFDEHNLERLRAADTPLLGAATYMALKGYWPAVAENPVVSPAVANNPDVADLHRETGQRNNEVQKVVEAQGPAGQGHPDVREPHALERLAGRRTRRRAPPHGRRLRPGRRYPGFRRRAGPSAEPRGHPAPGRLGQCAAALPGGQPRRMMSRMPRMTECITCWAGRQRSAGGLGVPAAPGA